MVIFALITVSLSMAFDTAVRTQRDTNRRLEQDSTVRSIFASLSRDIQAAYISAQNPACVFIGSPSGGSSSVGASTGLLTLTTRSYRIKTGENTDETSNPTAPSALNQETLPQSDVAIVRYQVNSQTGALTREVSPIPSLEAMQSQETENPIQNLIATRVVELNLRYWDSTNSTWRNEWDYQQQNQQQTQPSGTTGTDPSATPPAPATTQTQGDSELPGQVEVNLVILLSDGTQKQYKTWIPVLTKQPQDNQVPPTYQPPTTTASPRSSGGN